MLEWVALFSFSANGWGPALAAGAWVTILLALATLPIGLAVGLAVAFARASSQRPLVFAGNIFTTVFRGLPELLTLFLVYFGGQMVLQKLASPFYGGDVEISAFLAGMIALGLVFGAYASEVFLGAYRAIPDGQREAARALGLSRSTTFRLVLLPQFVKNTLPGLSNLWLALLKDTSLVSVIALPDLLRQAQVAASFTREPFAFYAAVCAIYLALAIASSIILGGIERWSTRGDKVPVR